MRGRRRDALDFARGDHLFDDGAGHVGIDGAGAESQQAAEVVHFARLGALHDQAAAGAQAFADQVVMHSADGQQRRQGRLLLTDLAVGQDQHRGAGGERFAGSCQQPRDALFQSGLAVPGCKDHWQGGDADARDLGGCAADPAAHGSTPDF